MEQLPTVHDFLFNHASDIHTMGDDDNKICYCVIQPQALIEFAKIHCIAQQKAIIENVTIDDIGSPNGDGEWMPCNIINKDSIITAYPLSNIK